MSSTGRGSERVEHDVYTTPAWCVRALLRRHPALLLLRPILEPAAGDGAILRVLLEEGVPPEYIRGIERRPGAAAVCNALWVTTDCGDFLTGDLVRVRPQLVIGNPPYSQAEAFVRLALDLVGSMGTVAMLLRLGFAASQARAEWHRERRPSVYVLPRRPSFIPGGGTDSCDYAWFMWRPRPGGDRSAEIDWLGDGQ